ncbi:MAG: hypothetical protein NWS69_00015, partial [Pseudomonadales bacterium]|nr:hypothetical protein [Pseudomonadales bacterium]
PRSPASGEHDRANYRLKPLGRGAQAAGAKAGYPAEGALLVTSNELVLVFKKQIIGDCHPCFDYQCFDYQCFDYLY